MPIGAIAHHVSMILDGLDVNLLDKLTSHTWAINGLILDHFSYNGWLPSHRYSMVDDPVLAVGRRFTLLVHITGHRPKPSVGA